MGLGNIIRGGRMQGTLDDGEGCEMNGRGCLVGWTVLSWLAVEYFTKEVESRSKSTSSSGDEHARSLFLA